MRAWIFCFFSFLLVQNSYALTRHHPLLPVKVTPNHSSALPNITDVVVKGPFNLNLHTGYNKPNLLLTGEPHMLDNVDVHVENGILFLSIKDPSAHCCTSITADIQTRYLNGLIFHGKGNIKGERLRANLERIVIDNPGTTILNGTIRLNSVKVMKGSTQISGVVAPYLKVEVSEGAKLKLEGVASMRHLTIKDNSWFSLSWLKATTLILRASDHAYVEIAGIVNKLDVELCNYAQFNGRYLRARRAYVKTRDYSVAKMAATQHQHTLATDASDIRFYNLPVIKTDFMALDGAVLDMRLLSSPLVEEPTPYNTE